jgi:3-methylcrotonyl-CoA carboxylase alpha subunit
VAPYYTWIDGARVHVWVNGRVYEFEKVDGSARRGGRSAEAAVSDTVKAPMPGTVLKVLAQAGVEFEAHQALIVLESMKMEMSLSVPHAGVVLDILCKEGALVEMGAVLARLGSIAESAT